MSKKEKNIVRTIRDMYQFSKRVDHVQTDLPIDLLTFYRFYAFDTLVTKVSNQSMDDMISYQNLHEVFIQMGLIPFNNDIREWAVDLS